jgi:hypothetical protein
VIPFAGFIINLKGGQCDSQLLEADAVTTFLVREPHLRPVANPDLSIPF